MINFRLLYGGIPSDNPSDPRKVRVLVADLSPTIADVWTMILNESGFSAYAAHSLQEALMIARDHDIDVAIIELLISERNAIHAAERILALRPTCRIIISTGQNEPVVSWVRRDAEERIGGCDVLCRPYDPPDLFEILRGGPIPKNCAIPSQLRDRGETEVPPADESTYLSGQELEDYLSDSRRLVLEMIEEQQPKYRLKPAA